MPTKFAQTKTDITELESNDLIEFTYLNPHENGPYRCGYVVELTNKTMSVVDLRAGNFRNFSLDKVKDICLLTPEKFEKSPVDKFLEGLNLLKSAKESEVLLQENGPIVVKTKAELSRGRILHLERLGWARNSDGIWQYKKINS